MGKFVTLSVLPVAVACVGYAAMKVLSSASTSKVLLLRKGPLGKEDIIIGCSSLAGMYQPIGDSLAVETIKVALDAGFVDYDTAPHYGLGLSEERLGKGLKAHANGRPFRVWTKSGRIMKHVSDVKKEDTLEIGNIPGTPGCIFVEADLNLRPVLDYTGSGMRQSYEDSKARIGLDIYGLRIHDADEEDRLAQTLAKPGGGVEGMVELRSRGLISEVSLGMNEPAAILRVLRAFPKGTIDCVMVAGAWNLLDQDAAELLLECQKRNIRVHNAGIFASGLLVGGSTYKYGPAPPEVKQKTQAWRELCEEHRVPLPVAAFAFALLPSVVEKVAVGVKSPAEVKQALAWLEATKDVPTQLWRDAKLRGLLAECVPLP
uniref:NADP-dependent oxidoreductase domain-containing protein n=1 Tax=Pyramimonas obovata TaxID=1411642 RepID=A0A7S0N6H5_9CHLO|mmetsp:Transcript_20196/g.44232  ORF Transcript_20196/g.44232 Transcript_20196/m.44232 type:complete len:374 (+) Transcript_20196:27-1148(+)